MATNDKHPKKDQPPVNLDKLGWIPPHQRSPELSRSVDRILSDMPRFSAVAGELADTGKGKRQLLYKYLEKVYGGRYPVVRQGIGDCVSFGFMKRAAILMAVRIVKENLLEDWPGCMPATEWIYGTSRVLVGGGRLGNSDGSVGAWADKANRENGILFRKTYTLDGQIIDLTNYSATRAKSWGYRGLPYGLEVQADEHFVKDSVMVTSFERARDLIQNGYPVAVCSDQGFTSTRDSKGFIRPSGSWAHCMCFIGQVSDTGRPGLVLDNSSWGDWVDGPNPEDLSLPAGCALVDADICDRMLRQQDSFAATDMVGFARQDLDWTLF